MLVKALHVPLLLQALAWNKGIHYLVHYFVADMGNGFRDVVHVHQPVALFVDHLALVVGEVVVFEQLLADIEVASLDLALRVFDRTRHPGMFDRLARLHAEFLHDARQALRTEDAQQIIFEREIEARRSRVALATGTAAQLIVDAPRFMTLGADDLQSTSRDDLLVALLPVRT